MSKQILTELKSLIKQNLHVNASIDCQNASIRRQLQHFLTIRPKNIAQHQLYDSIMNHAVQAESICPGSGIIFLSLLSNLESSSINVPNSRIHKNDLNTIFCNHNISNKAISLLMTAFEHCNINSKISIRKSPNSETYIEASEGYCFSLRSMLKLPTYELRDAKVVCIDGYIESVSELHHLLESCAESKVPCVVIVRGMSDDVLHTIKINNERNTITCIPYVCPFDPENVNTIVDIATAAGTDIVSSLKGDLISSIKFESIATVENCLCSSEGIQIKNSTTLSRVKFHISSLKEKLKENPGIDHIVTSRIRALSSARVDICIPNNAEYYHLSSQLDEGIRIITSILNMRYDPEKVAKEILMSFNKLYDETLILDLLTNQVM